jgi:hypothetical protein
VPEIASRTALTIPEMVMNGKPTHEWEHTHLEIEVPSMLLFSMPLFSRRIHALGFGRWRNLVVLRRLLRLAVDRDEVRLVKRMMANGTCRT